MRERQMCLEHNIAQRGLEPFPAGGVISTVHRNRPVAREPYHDECSFCFGDVRSPPESAFAVLFCPMGYSARTKACRIKKTVERQQLGFPFADGPGRGLRPAGSGLAASIRSAIAELGAFDREGQPCDGTQPAFRDVRLAGRRLTARPLIDLKKRGTATRSSCYTEYSRV